MYITITEFERNIPRYMKLALRTDIWITNENGEVTWMIRGIKSCNRTSKVKGLLELMKELPTGTGRSPAPGAARS